MLVSAVELFEDVIDQKSAVTQLQITAKNPVHAYLFLGPKGSCKWDAAKAFAANILSNNQSGQDQSRTINLVKKGEHPDLIRISPTGNQYRDDDVQLIINEASRSPIEGNKKIIVADRFHTANETAVGRLLKTLEEPPPAIIIILLSEIIPRNQITIASRCQKVQFNRISDSEMERWLQQHVHDSEVIQLITIAARGDIQRAIDLISDPNIGNRYDLWRSTLENLQPQGYAIASAVNELQKEIDQAEVVITNKHDQELEELMNNEKELVVNSGRRSQIEASHKREIRRFRTQEIEFGLSVFSTVFRERLLNVPDKNCMDAIKIIKDANTGLKRNANEKLLLTSLLISLSEMS